MSNHGKIAVVAGVANKYSIAYGIVQAMLDEGMTVVCLVLPDIIKHAKRATDGLEKDSGDMDRKIVLMECDLENKVGQIGADKLGYGENNLALAKAVKDVEERFGRVDYLVHAVAHSIKDELEGSIFDVTVNNFHHTMDVSALSFLMMCRAFAPIMNDGGSICTMTFRGSSACAGNYGIMGIAKAALESAMRYIAEELGPRGIRVIALAPGPIKTMAASAIKDFETSLFMGEVRSATGKNVTAAEVGRTALRLMDCEGITGAVIPVDNGIWDMVGMGTTKAEMGIMREERSRRKAAAKSAEVETIN